MKMRMIMKSEENKPVPPVLKLLMTGILLIFGLLASCQKQSEPPPAAIQVTAFQNGDHIVLVDDASLTAVSRWNRKYSVESARVWIGTRTDTSILTRLSDDVQIMEVIADGDSFQLRGENGYLCLSPDGRKVSFRDDRSLAASCTMQDGHLLLSVLDSEGTEQNRYLSYDDSSTLYSLIYPDGDNVPSSFQIYHVNEAYEASLKQEDTYVLPLYETSDIHGAYIYDDGTEWQMRMAYMAHLIKEAGTVNGEYRRDRIVLLDGGDVFQGSPITSLLGNQPMSAIFDQMHYDAVMVGNHEFDNGLSEVMDLDGTMIDYTRNGELSVNTTPYVISNLTRNNRKIDGLRAYLILEKTAADRNGNELPVRIGVIGFASDYSSSVARDRFILEGYQTAEDYETLKNLAHTLKHSYNCHAVVVLAHADSKRTAEALGADSDVDLVFGGHLHKLIHGETDDGIKYVSPGNNAGSLAHCSLLFRNQKGSAKLLRAKEAHAEYLTDNPPLLYDKPENTALFDPDVSAAGNEYLLLLSGIFNLEIGYITVPATRYDYLPESGKHASSKGNWVSSIFMRAAEADVGIINSGALRLDFTIPEGKDRRTIHISDIYAMFPFEDSIYCFEITCEEFLAAMQYAVGDGGWGLISRMSGIDCIYQKNPAKVCMIRTEAGEVIYDNGVWADGWKDRTLTVALNSFAAETDRVSESGMHNPFVSWIDTPKHIRTISNEAEAVIDVLSAEAKESDGLLQFDTRSHFILTEPE